MVLLPTSNLYPIYLLQANPILAGRDPDSRREQRQGRCSPPLDSQHRYILKYAQLLV